LNAIGLLAQARPSGMENSLDLISWFSLKLFVLFSSFALLRVLKSGADPKVCPDE
jgi:hypothetical protein